MFKKFSILLFIYILFCGNIYAQSAPDIFQRAMDAFRNNEFLIAHKLFYSLKNRSDVENDMLSSANYYSAESLSKAGQTNGAAGEYEEFVRDFPVSNFRDIALYNLGIIYYKSRNYQRCREKLITLVNEFPRSDYFGAANYWIGEAFIAENRLLEAEEFLLQSITTRDRNSKVNYSIYSLGNLYERKKDFEKAVAYYDELLSYYRESELIPYAQLRIGISYYRLNDFENAVLELTDPAIFELPENLQIDAEYVLANAYSRTKEFEKAKTIFREILDRTPQGITEDQIIYGLAWVNFQTNDFERSYELFNSLIASLEDSIRIKSLYWSAESKRYGGKIEDAVKIYQQFLNLYPDDINAFSVKYNIGIIYYNRKDFVKALSFLKEAVKASDNNISARALTLMGEINLDLKKYSEGVELFEKAQLKLPTNFSLRSRIDLGLGTAYYYTNNFVSSISVLEKLARRDESFEIGKVHFYLAESYFAKGKFEKARDNFKRIPPTAGLTGKQALYGLAYSYFDLRDYANSSYYFKEYIKMFPKDNLALDAKLRLVDSFFGMKNYSQAVKNYSAIFKKYRISKIVVREHFQYGQSLFKLNKPAEAIKIFRNLQILFPKSKYADDAQYFIGWISFKQNRYSEAVSEYYLVPNKYPESPIIPLVYNSIGDCYFNMGNYEEAITFYNTVINEYPQSKYVFDALNGITYSYLIKDQPENAASVIDNFVALNPSSKFGDDILYKKGELYFNVGAFEEARLGYKEFIATYPKSRFVPDAYFWIAKSSFNLGHIEDALYNYSIVKDNYLFSNVGMSAIIEMGKIYAERNEPERELDVYDYAIEKLKDAKGIEEIRFYRAKALLALKKFNQAYEELKNITVYFENSVFADKSKLELGLLELARNKFESAENLFKEVGEKRNDDIGAEAQYYYGNALFEQAKYTDAISALVRVRSVFSRYDIWYSKALIKLGDCYVKIKNKKNARAMYRAVLKRHKNDELGKEAKSKLRRL